MVSQGLGRIVIRHSKVGNKVYTKFFIYIPTSVAKDSLFPFKPGERVMVRIQDNKLVIEPIKEKSEKQ
ncbi:MAG: hypothetical protein DRJ66_05215 [Thermoprotei archaeon]|nr:MAG: hypothetical protein DRJ66_05215 [Thermoprotei archaeon]RLF20814.1 MAG: hypothetical protein DRZ82_00855 [Thermoprotei archaeon]